MVISSYLFFKTFDFRFVDYVTIQKDTESWTFPIGHQIKKKSGSNGQYTVTIDNCNRDQGTGSDDEDMFPDLEEIPEPVSSSRTSLSLTTKDVAVTSTSASSSTTDNVKPAVTAAADDTDDSVDDSENVKPAVTAAADDNDDSVDDSEDTSDEIEDDQQVGSASTFGNHEFIFFY